MDLMPIDHIDDWEQRIARQDAFWNCEIIDRPVVLVTLGKENPAYPRPSPKGWPSFRARWMDTEYIAESALANAMNTEYLGDALPAYDPNLGPEVFSSFFGTEMEYGEETSWSIPNLLDWSEVDNLQLSKDNFYWKKLIEITDALLEIGKGKFYTGMTDWHPGGDCLAAFRDPATLALDMLEHRDEVENLLSRITRTYLEVFDFYYDKLTAARQAMTNWAGIVSSKKWYVPSNDFSCMISREMFDQVFVPGITQECRALEASLYHLDGPQALRHLDSLLDIKELNAIQWVYGAGNGRPSDWMAVYKRCQDAGKGLQLGLGVDELDFFMQNLKPEGLWIALVGVENRDHAEAMIRKIASWR